jgi:hypothetical protein
MWSFVCSTHVNLSLSNDFSWSVRFTSWSERDSKESKDCFLWWREKIARNEFDRFNSSLSRDVLSNDEGYRRNLLSLRKY